MPRRRRAAGSLGGAPGAVGQEPSCTWEPRPAAIPGRGLPASGRAAGLLLWSTGYGAQALPPVPCRAGLPKPAYAWKPRPGSLFSLSESKGLPPWPAMPQDDAHLHWDTPRH